MKAVVIALFLLGCVDAPKPLTFEEYAVIDIFKGAPAAVDLTSHPKARRFQKLLLEGAAKGPNFAGHFTIVEWGCGTQCQYFAIIDTVSGRVYLPPRALSNGLCYRLDSSLLITNPIHQQTLDSWDGNLPEWLVTSYYNWDGSKLVELAASRTVTRACGD